MIYFTLCVCFLGFFSRAVIRGVGCACGIEQLSSQVAIAKLAEMARHARMWPRLAWVPALQQEQHSPPKPCTADSLCPKLQGAHLFCQERHDATYPKYLPGHLSMLAAKGHSGHKMRMPGSPDHHTTSTATTTTTITNITIATTTLLWNAV